MKIPAVYPISLSEGVVKRLFEQHFGKEHQKALDGLFMDNGGELRLEYSGRLEENGEVVITLWHSLDRYGISQAGPLIRQQFRPYDEIAIAELVKKRKVEIAMEVYLERQRIEMKNAVLAIRKELFGDE